ncbi:hypothetical protein [Hankyongella ginsenosidimutans]|uniref:hypothetical protein n=1 Tax=Hankyongella ginsenosidimutans TaxID=1763828 RepID=UPI002482C41D|nr:hypothetical protein [Hankyongella ginsenosidimutans]
MLDLAQLLTRAHVLPVLTVDRVEDALPLTQALIDGGLTAIEVTLRTPVALEAIRIIRNAALPIAVGAGTVQTGLTCERRPTLVRCSPSVPARRRNCSPLAVRTAPFR